MDSRLIDIKHPVTICKASAGTGKTYTLAAYYIGLLLSGEDYRSILAITFTNKATAEMSERILGYLHGIAEGGEDDFLAYAKRFMLRDADMPDELLRQRAGECFKRMLLDYDNVQIQTIDSFLQTLLSGLAGILHMSAGFKTELDLQHVIQCAVDQLLSADASEEDKKIIADFMKVRLDEENTWNVRRSLCALATELYTESVQVLETENKVHFNPELISRLRTQINKMWDTHPIVRRIYELLNQLESADLSGTNGSSVLSAMNKIRQSLVNPKKLRKNERFRGLTDNQLPNAQAGKWTKLPGDAVQAIVEATLLIRQVMPDYYTKELSLELSHEMELMASLQRIIQANLNEANSALLSKTAGTLSKALHGGDADFILEKAGIRYHHILMDEFQDTSKLQWDVIVQLLKDVLAGEGNTLLIVGDIKQSIYRWRNGDWHIMDKLNFGERTNTRFTSLTRNFRSREEVVKFNLSLFRYMMNNYAQEVKIADEDEQKQVKRIYNEDFEDALLDQYYRSKDRKGGYVRFKAFEDASLIIDEMFQTMESLLSQGVSASDMMVLVRNGYQAAEITNAHSLLDVSLFPCLSQASFVSATSYLLDASEAVKVIINALRVVVNNDPVAVQYLEDATQIPDVIGKIRARVKSDLPLYEAMNELINLLLADESGQYKGSETAYINNLLDRTREYVGAYGSRIDTFLTYWDDALHEKPITASASGAIRIMTIHKSKGLQAQTLFVPFCNWKKDESKESQKIWCKIADSISPEEEYLPIPNRDEMAYTAYSRKYKEEHLNQRIDSLNMLYVALTRAEDNLYIYSTFETDNQGNRKDLDHVGQYLTDFVQGEEYEAGTPVVRKDEEGRSKDENEKTKDIRAEVWANSEQVRFVQSQEGALYTEYGDEAYRRVARIDEGTLCHEIFAHLRKVDELEAVLDEFESRGEIKDHAQRETLKSLISSAWEGSPEMRDWFTAPWELRLEEAIYYDQRELRPDRVMINPHTKEAIVLDYKFGHWEDKYVQQVREYMDALQRIGYGPVRGYLWFARTNTLKPVTHG